MLNLRNEYPRPQLVRENWLCLNGKWNFEIDDSKDLNSEFNSEINVPFCPESSLSGINVKSFMKNVRYRKTFTLPCLWENKNIILHFGAVDYKSDLYINHKFVGTHKGGYSSFSFDITEFVKNGENEIILFVEDDTISKHQPSGKQSMKPDSHGCYYTRTTGIWQTVWLESTDSVYVNNIDYSYNIDLPSVTVKLDLCGDFMNKKIICKTSYKDVLTGEITLKCNSKHTEFNINLTEKHLWEVGNGRLYDVNIEISDDEKIYDSINSYFGLREISLTKNAFVLNGKVVFQRTVLDQGFYPDGIYTAPSDEALHNDIIYSKSLGFNGARLHEKVFEPRYLYWADVEGYLVWGEYPNWGLSLEDYSYTDDILPEWLECISRDRSHPSIIGWCPFNETWKFVQNPVVKLVYLATKAADSSRPVIDTSGNYHTVTDIFDVHDYEQDTVKFASYYKDIDKGLIKDQIYRAKDGPSTQTYKGEPVFMSEYGGIKWSKQEGWGYGQGPESESEFIERYKKLTETLLFDKHFMGFCYTQLYDVEQEQNGLMTYERKFKFDPEIFKKINSQKAAIEE